MDHSKEIEPGQVVDALGELIAALAAFAAKVPAQSFMAMPGGIRPSPEVVESYEDIVYRFRDRVGKSTFKILTTVFLDSLEAFEAGRVFDAVPPLQQAVEQLVELHNGEKVKFSPDEQNRIREFKRRLEKILPRTPTSQRLNCLPPRLTEIRTSPFRLQH